MAKSLRSKWKKHTKQLKTKKFAPIVAANVEKLNEKLALSAEGKLGRHVPMQEDKHKGYKHSMPKVDVGKPLQLEPLTTRVVTYGVNRPTENDRLHAQHPERQPGRYVNPADEDAKLKMLATLTEADAMPTAGGDDSDDDAVVMSIGAETGMVNLTEKTAKKRTGKKITLENHATRLTQSTGRAPISDKEKKAAAKRKLK
jgi:hypothetical protein